MPIAMPAKSVKKAEKPIAPPVESDFSEELVAEFDSETDTEAEVEAEEAKPVVRKKAQTDKPAGNPGGWFATGYQTPIETRVLSPFRFWMRADDKKSAEITFVDDSKPRIVELDGVKIELTTPFIVNEHTVKEWGRKRVEQYTCLAGTGKQCPLCAAGRFTSQMAMYTIIDHSEWKSEKDGKTHKDELRLFAVQMSSSPYKQLKQFEAKTGSLRGQRFTVQRLGGSKSPRVGDVYTAGERKTLSPKIKPLDYLTLFAPLSYEQLSRIASNIDDGRGGSDTERADV